MDRDEVVLRGDFRVQGKEGFGRAVTMDQDVMDPEDFLFLEDEFLNGFDVFGRIGASNQGVHGFL